MTRAVPVLAGALWLLFLTCGRVQAQPVETPCVSPVAIASPESPPDPAEVTRLHDLATGRGVLVAVIDTGVAPHPELLGVLAVGDLVSRETPEPLLDCDGHGTIVAGVIAGHSLGIAPDAQILSIRQTSSHTRASDIQSPEQHTGGTLASLAEAVHLALDNGAHIINISVVACVPPETAVQLDSVVLDEALARAEAQQSVVVAAGGNLSPECQPGAVVYPSHSPTVLSIDARETAHSLADYSLGPPEGAEALSAPAYVPAALSPDANGWASAVETETGETREFHGSSFAAPVVSGTAALLRERYPHYSAAEIRAHIVGSSAPAGGAVDPMAALTFVPSDAEGPVRQLSFSPDHTLGSGQRARFVLLATSLMLAGAGGLLVAGLRHAPRSGSSPAGHRARGSESRALPGPRSPR